MKTASQLLLITMASALTGNAPAADASGSRRPAVDTSKWECKLCKFEDGLSGTVDVGAGYVSDSSAKFGDYTGLNKQGGYFIGDGTVRMRGPGAGYLDVEARDLGLDSRSIGMEGGQQGKYKLFLKYDELPHYISDTVQTPFVGNGGASLQLPPGFPAPTTGLMPLGSTLRPFDIETKRKGLGIGASLNGAPGWEYAVDYRHETRDGTKRTAGSFYTSAAQLIEPIDYVTDQVNASVSFTGARFQGKFAYYGSFFRNSNDALNWQNPFTTSLGFPGAVAGQLALPPDNQFHQVSAALGYQLSERTRASADIAYGRMTQDEGFLAPTLNAAVVAPALPRATLDARANTLNANVKLTSAVTDELRLNAAFIYDDRDNRTSQSVYPWVTTDMFLATPRVNTPYSFTKEKFKLSGDYRFAPSVRASVGYDYEWYKRTYQEVDETREGTIWGRLNMRAFENVDLILKLAHAERDNSGYQVLPWVDPPENPLMRKYNMADRKRDSGGLRAEIAATETISIGLGFDASEDRYKESPIGLTSAKDYGVNGDASFMLTERTSLHVFANYQRIKSNQSGSTMYSTPDWTAENEDTVKLFGVGIKHAAIKDKLDLGADLTYTRSRNTIAMNTGALDSPPFPNRENTLEGLKLYAIYRIKDNVSVHGGYWYERNRSDDWALDGVAPATIPNVLTFGEQAPRYHVNVFRVSLRYKF